MKHQKTVNKCVFGWLENLDFILLYKTTRLAGNHIVLDKRHIDRFEHSNKAFDFDTQELIKGFVKGIIKGL